MTDPSQDSQPSVDSLTQRIDRICDEFEATWQQDNPAQIEDFLLRVEDGDRPELLGELLAVEIALRRQQKQQVGIDEYLQRFAHQHQAVHRAFGYADAHSPSLDLTRSFLHGVTIAHDRPASAFSALPVEVLDSCTEQLEFSPGEYLIRQGEPGSSLMMICQGTVKIQAADAAGAKYVLGYARQGQMVGEMSLLTDEPRTADVMAVDRVGVLMLPADTFHTLARKYPELSVILTNLVADRLGQSGRDALTGKVLDRYRIKGRLGKGGMGVVYEAEDTSSRETVALKMLSHRLVYNTEALRRFRQEAAIIDAFEHENIVRLLHRFAAFHTYFLSMEFCAGQTLQERINSQGALSTQVFCQVMRQLARALRYAHRENIVHRDIKPSNIMLDSQGTVKLTDFGLAEPVQERFSRDARVVGTPRYMAPEQRVGKKIRKQSDYFSLGCVAYEMLAGRPLFRGSNLEELNRDFSRWQPPRFATLRPDLPVEICELLQPSLETHSRDRSLNLKALAAWSVSG